MRHDDGDEPEAPNYLREKTAFGAADKVETEQHRLIAAVRYFLWKRSRKGA